MADPSLNVEELLKEEYDTARDEFDIIHYIIGCGLVFLMMWMAGLICNNKEPAVQQEEDDHDTPWRLADIKPYDGKGPDGKIYISCMGRVFDVTSSYNFQPGGDYENFGGHDVSMACANYSTEDKWLDVPYDPDNNDLKFSQQQMM